MLLETSRLPQAQTPAGLLQPRQNRDIGVTEPANAAASAKQRLQTTNIKGGRSSGRMRRAARAASDGIPPTQRLPVNHRRHRVPPDSRKRVSTACNGCNVRRVKCSGERPCQQCRAAQRDCQYPQVVDKVSIPRSQLEELQTRCASLERCLGEAVPDEASRRDLLSRLSVEPSSSSAGSISSSTMRDLRDDDQADTEGRLLSDPDGTNRYLGATSGATFLDLIKEFLRTLFPLASSGQGSSQHFLGSLGHYQTHDSRPLVLGDVGATEPLMKDMVMMLSLLRYFLQDANGAFASGGIFYWGELDLSLLDSPQRSPEPRTLALFQTAFAMACQMEQRSEGDSSLQRGETFFGRARMLMGNPLNTTASSVNDMAILAMMAMYLVEMNRRDLAYTYVNLGMHTAVMHGVHLGVGVTDEKGSRAFWTLYIMDRWLSILQGRPPSIPDDAIRLAMPADEGGLPPAMGLAAHVELSKVAGYIVCNTYRIAPTEPSMPSVATRIDQALGLLSNWAARLPAELQMVDVPVTNDRARYELHMTHYQLIILTVRPIFFAAVKKVVAERLLGRHVDLEEHVHISRFRQCIAAARSNMRLGRWVRTLSSRKLLSGTLHHLFNSAIILLLRQLLFDSADKDDMMDILFAVESFEDEARGGRTYPSDCVCVLRELSSLVQRLRSRNLDDLFLETGAPGPAMMLEATPPPPPPATAAYDVGFILNHDVVQSSAQSGHSALCLELETWINPDELQMYENHLMPATLSFF